MELTNKQIKLILSHPTGNAFVRSASRALLEADMLSEFYTTVASFSGSLLDRLSAVSAFSEIRRRRFDLALKPFTKTSPWKEMGRQIAVKKGLNRLTRHETGIFSVDAVYKNLDKKVAARIRQASTPRINGIYAYEDGAIFSFRAAKQRGLQCLYDLPIGYWRSAAKLLEKERERRPDWIPTLIGLSDSESKFTRKDEELQLADRVFVASSFTAQTLQEFPGNLPPVEVIPYAFPPVDWDRTYRSLSTRCRLKLLFVGGLSQRKGIADLFAATEALGNHIELTIVGLKTSENCPALDEALRRHRWIPGLPHEEILKLMRAHDILVFPSLFEGFGLVISEAMSQGTPVITTDRTAGPDIINHGHNGWLVNAGSAESLQTAIEDLLINPQLIIEAGKAAMDTASRRPWEIYEKEVIKAIRKHFSCIGQKI